jgi:hypothetical protein
MEKIFTESPWPQKTRATTGMASRQGPSQWRAPHPNELTFFLSGPFIILHDLPKGEPEYRATFERLGVLSHEIEHGFTLIA